MRARRREFITLLTSAAIAGPRAAIAQTAPKIFRLGTLANATGIELPVNFVALADEVIE